MKRQQMPAVRRIRRGWVRVTDRKGRRVYLREADLGPLFALWMSVDELRAAIKTIEGRNDFAYMMKRLYPAVTL